MENRIFDHYYRTFLERAEEIGALSRK
jgi:hypothetical protein